MVTSMHYGASSEIFQIAESLRKDMTEAERSFGKEFVKTNWVYEFEGSTRFGNLSPISIAMN